MFAGALPVAAQESTANVEVRVWQKISDGRSIYLSARPEGGDWDTLGTIPLPLDDGYSSSGNYRYGDVTVEGVEVRVWQRVSDLRGIYISARPEGGDWGALGTIPLPLDDGFSSSGAYRYGDITIAVPPSNPAGGASCRLEQRSAVWNVEGFALNASGDAGRSIGTAQWPATFSFDWGWGQVFGGRPDMVLLDATMQIVVAHPAWVGFRVGGDDGFALYLNEEVVLEDWDRGSRRTWERHRWMQPGVHELRLRYYERSGRADLLFETDQAALAWSEATACGEEDRARLSAMSPKAVLLDGALLTGVDSSPAVVFLQGIDSESSCEAVRTGWEHLDSSRRVWAGASPASRLGPIENMFTRRGSIVEFLQDHLPGDWEESVIGFSYSGLYEDCETGSRISGEAYPIGSSAVFPAYDSLHTCRGVRNAAGHLHALISSIHAADNNREIIVIGHSLGGMVAAYYLSSAAPPDLVERMRHVITVDSPLLGNFVVSPLSECHEDPRSWQDIRGESDVVGVIESIPNSDLSGKFIHLNSTVIGDSLSGGRTVRLGCAPLLGIVWGHGCGFYDPVALREIVNTVRND